MIKAYRYPYSETLLTWAVSLIASVCAVLSVGKIDWVLLARTRYTFSSVHGLCVSDYYWSHSQSLVFTITRLGNNSLYRDMCLHRYSSKATSN